MSHCWSGSLSHCGVVCSAVVVSGQLCQFPSDHPIQDLESGGTVPVLEMGNNHVYIYTDQFGSCHGCVRSLRFCYRPQTDEFITIETRALKCKTLGGMVSHSTAATHISVVCIYCACACECLAAPSRPSPVSRLFHAGCTSS